jgi:hypothetical protein
MNNKYLFRLVFVCFMLVVICERSGAGSITASAFNMMQKNDIADSEKWLWDFNENNDTEGWTIAKPLRGAVMGGALWIRIQPDTLVTRPLRWQQMIWGPNCKYDLVSPRGLSIPSQAMNKIKMRILNRSSETDGFVFWRNSDNPEKDGGRVRFTMKPDCAEWQEVICHMDGRWQGTIEQIRIQPASNWWRGDMWIDWIKVSNGDPKPRPIRPNLCSPDVVPQIIIPGITQSDFNDAFKVLDECLVVDVPLNGFNYPFLAPGGAYGENWWQLDGSLNMAGAKWVNEKVGQDMMRGFAEVQAYNPDGRIDLWGGAPVRGQVANASSLPCYFEAAHDMARRTSDKALQTLIYTTMQKYLEYWFSPAKRDERTGLILAVFEETFSYPHDRLDHIAAVDLNVAVALGCHHTASLAEKLGRMEEAGLHWENFNALARAINQYLWDESLSAYCNYDTKNNRTSARLLCTTFDPLRLGIAPDNRVIKLQQLLTSTELFNWSIRPVTSIARTEPDYVEATGPYDGRAWFGDIWTLRNMAIIAGLKDAGLHDLAAELNWSTIQTFNANFCEYIVPCTGAGEGVKRYGWSASQYIQAIIEHLFGIDYDCLNGHLRIFPHVPKYLTGQEISIRNLILPASASTRLDVSVKQSADGRNLEIGITIRGLKPALKLQVLCCNPENIKYEIRNHRGKILTAQENFYGVKGAIGVELKMAESERITFRAK